ncbi:hypothetical protein [Kocuria rhizophila]|uniref:hypothetical protein n=1 Tax=Kocuria rhizophila TaxID=72000 RepID=UPI001145E844|nr:hypothetical protein [Kocuria rhizophila]
MSSSQMRAFADAVEGIGRDVSRVLADAARAGRASHDLRESRARRRDLDRPRVSVHQAGAGLFSRLPHADPRNLLPAGGRLRQDGWHVWTLQPEPASESITGSFVGSFDTWDEAMLVAHHVAEHGRVPAQWVPDISAILWCDAIEEDVFCGVGEVPC